MPPPTSGWMRIGELSRRVGVGVDTLRAWERRYGVLSPRRSGGNTRLYSALDEARVRLMQRYISDDVPVAQAAQMALTARLRLKPGSSGTVAEHEAERARGVLGAALERFDETAAEQVLAQLLGAYTETAVLRHVVIPYLHALGERWASAHATVAQEHFASGFLHARLLSLARGWDRGLGPRLVLAAVPGDFHTLGLVCLGIAAARLGCRVSYLGAATPVQMLAGVAMATAADAVVLSRSLDGTITDPEAAVLRELAARWPLMLGGPAADSEVAARCGALWLEGDPMTEARRLVLEILPRGDGVTALAAVSRRVPAPPARR